MGQADCQALHAVFPVPRKQNCTNPDAVEAAFCLEMVDTIPDPLLN